MNFIEIAKILLQLLPTLIEAVKAVEAALPPGTAGAVKLELVKQTLTQANAVSGNAIVQFEKIWPAVAGIVGTLVTTLNAQGLFHKAAAPVAAPVVAPAIAH
jgi:hypothetical protein